MDTVTIEARPREVGKKAAKQVRRSGNVPCILYGHAAAVNFQVHALDLRKLVFTDELYRVELKLEKDTFDCILKEVEFNPVSAEPIHADFQVLRAGEKIEIDVPVRFIGKAIGQIEGGDIQYLVHDLEISAFPKHIPEAFEVDITNLRIGDTIHLADIPIPEGVEMLTPLSQSLVSCFVRKVVEEVVEELVPELPEGELVEEGAAAAEAAEEGKEEAED